jgi:hypothetical protein
MAHTFKVGERLTCPDFAGTINAVYPAMHDSDRAMAVVWCDDGITRHVLAAPVREAPQTTCGMCGNNDVRQMVDNGEAPDSPTYQLLCKLCKHFWFVN